MTEDAASLSDRVFGWDSDYKTLQEAGIEAVKASRPVREGSRKDHLVVPPESCIRDGLVLALGL